MPFLDELQYTIRNKVFNLIIFAELYSGSIKYAGQEVSGMVGRESVLVFSSIDWSRCLTL